MIKGHAVIELKNMQTGEVQRIEHDNMITNGIKYALTPWLGKHSFANLGSATQIFPDGNTEDRKKNNKSIMNHLLGGIFLFQNPLEENVDNIEFPTDNPLTGKASWDAYNGADTYRGTYNENESGLQDDGSYRHTWDFSTSQANGQISAVALTTYKGGVCGCGYKEWKSTETAINEDPYFCLGTIRISKDNEGADCTPIVRAASNEIYYVTHPYYLKQISGYKEKHIGTAKKIQFTRKKFPLSSLSPFYDFYNQYISENIEIDIPDEFADYIENYDCKGHTSDKYLYIYKIKRVLPGEQCMLLRIKKDDFEIQTLSITNNSQEIWLYNSFDEMNFSDNYMYTIAKVEDDKTSTYCLQKVNLMDNTIENISVEGYANAKRIAGFLYFKNNKGTWCLNPDTLDVRMHPNIDESNRRYYTIYNTEKLVPGVYLRILAYTVSSTLKYIAEVLLSANSLMTINNLPSPVVKTAAQTMKITYTIQETS